MFAAFAARDAALDEDGGAGGDGLEVFDLHLASHGGDAMGAVGFAHGFIEEGGDDAAVEIAGRALIVVRDSGEADNSVIGSYGEIKAQANGVGETAAEAVILRSVIERGEVFAGVGSGSIAHAERMVTSLLKCSSSILRL